MPPTSKRSIVMTDEEWQAIQTRAAALGKSAAAYLLDLAAEDIPDFPRNRRDRGGQPGNKNWKRRKPS